jgi:hypothetical protein
MSDTYLPPEPVPERNDGPAQEPEPASPAETSQPAVAAAGTMPAGAGPPAGVPDEGASELPEPPETPLDPAAVTGPPWPRLVAAAGAYTPPRLARWPIVFGILLFAGYIAALVTVSAVSSARSGYELTARDAHFTATFPGRPERVARAAGTATVIVYATTLSSHGVAVTYLLLPVSVPFSLDGAINGIAASLPGAKVAARNSLTYLGQPAEDAAITFSSGVSRIRIVRFGSAAYVLEGLGSSATSFAHDYGVLLDSFRPLQP